MLPDGVRETDAIRRTKHTRLYAIQPRWYQSLHDAMVRPGVMDGWRTRGRPLLVAEFENVIVRPQALGVVATTHSGVAIGMVELINFDALDRRAEVSVLEFEAHQGSGLIIEATLAALDEGFARFDLRKVYAHASPGASADTFMRAGELGIIQVEGTLTAFTLIDGRYADITIGSVTRDALTTALRNPLIGSLANEWRLTA